jgi:hypothetical protein
MLDIGDGAVVDSAGTTDRSRRCAVVSGDHQPPAQRSDLTAMHLVHMRFTTRPASPISGVDGRSVPWSR